MTDYTDQEKLELALRDLQKLDEAVSLGGARFLLIQAQDMLGDALDLVCTGDVDGTNEDGTVAYYEHNMETCPIHEWLVPEDQPEAEKLRWAIEAGRVRS